jgi:hypothetical protein
LNAALRRVIRVVAIDPMKLARQQLDDAVGEAMTKFTVKQREEMPVPL